MKSIVNECGTRNSFGFYDFRAKEIVIRRPANKKLDLQEVYEWVESAADLRKLSIGIGPVENFAVNDLAGGLYTAARSTIKANIIPNTGADNDLLRNVLSRIRGRKELRNVSLRCFMFSEDFQLFDLLLEVLKTLPALAYLDLGGCYFTDDQLIDLSRVLPLTYVANLVWPEPRMSPMVLEQVVRGLSTSRSIVVIQGVPPEMRKISEANRQWIFDFGRKPGMLSDKDIETIHEYKNSFRFAIAYRKNEIFDFEKIIESILV